jgi:hypothetical protein
MARKRERKSYGSVPEEHIRDAHLYGQHARFLLRSTRNAARSGRCSAAISQLAEAAIAAGKMAANRRGAGPRRRASVASVYSGAERAVAKLARDVATKCIGRK